MPDTLFISYKSEENPFALKLAAGLKNRGINVWIDRMDIHPGDDWDEAINHALKHHCRGMIVILTPDYLKSRVCHDEWSYALEKNLPVIPVLLRRLNDDDIQFRLRRIQRLDFLDWLDERAYQAKFELLVERIQHEQSDSFGDIPSAEVQYLTNMIADLESQQGVENYIALSAQSEVVRVDPRPRKNVEPSLALLLKPPTPEPDVRPATKKIDNIQQAVADHAQFVLIGDPGAGKTTTLRRLALEMARARLGFLTSVPHPILDEGLIPPLPFLVYLPRWSTEPTAADFIRRQWDATNIGGDVVRELQSGQVRLYLDGLNEMGGEGKKKAALLREWLQAPDGPRYAVITCRQGDYHDDLRLSDLPTVLVEPLTDEKIREFAVHYLGEEGAGPFLERVFPSKDVRNWERERVERRSLIHLARNPYLLAALTLIFEMGGDLPRNTGALFQQLVMVLWERERLRQTPGWIPFEDMQAAFGNLAFSMIDENMPIDVPLNYAEIKLRNADLVGIGRSANLITINVGEMRYTHQLMLEYFAAVGLLQVGLAGRLKKPAFSVFRREYHLHRTTTIWDNIVVALCGIVPTPSDVVNQVAALDPFLAADCLSSGIVVTWQTQTNMVGALSMAVRDGDSVYDAAAALGKIGDPTAVPTLLQTLRDPDYELRFQAAKALGSIGDPTSIPALLGALRDPNISVCWAAAEALGNIGTPALPALRDALRDPDSRLRSGAAKALGRIADPTAIPALLGALRDPNINVCWAAAEALGNIGTPALPALRDALRDPDINVRWAAAEALGNIGDPIAIPALCDAMHKANKYVRRAAAKALGNIGDPIAIPALRDALRDPDINVRWAAAEALGNIGTPALPALLHVALRDPDNDLRLRATEALDQIADPVAVPALLQALRDSDWRVSKTAAKALGHIGDPSAVPALVNALRDPDSNVSIAAEQALGKIGSPALPALLQALRDPDSDVRLLATVALGQIADPVAVPSLIEQLADTEEPPNSDGRVCDFVAKALEKIGTPKALEAVRRWREEQGNSDESK